MVKLKAQYDIRNTTSPNAQAATALQALKMGISQAVTIELTGGLDTHDEGWATDHPEKLKFGFDLLSLLIDDLEKTPHPKVPSKKLIDLTTIVVFSEFGRTPTLNNRDGRDHSLNNSCLLVGARIPHNRVIGGSSPNGMNSMGLDQTSGEPSKTGGYVITPKEIFASLMKNSGLDYSEMRTEAIPALLT